MSGKNDEEPAKNQAELHAHHPSTSPRESPQTQSNNPKLRKEMSGDYDDKKEPSDTSLNLGQDRDTPQDMNVSDDNENLPEILYPCGLCSIKTNRTVCEKCNEIYYCSEAHKKEHWEVHKKSCKGATAVSPREPISGQIASNKLPAVREQLRKANSRRVSQPPPDLSSPSAHIKLNQKKLIERPNDEDDNYNSEGDDPMDPNLPRLKAKRRILYHLKNGKFERAARYAEGQYMKTQGMLEKADKEAEYIAMHIDEIMQDYLMYAKCLLLHSGPENENLRKILSILSENIISCISVNYKEVKDSLAEDKEGAMEKNKKDIDTFSHHSGMSKSINAKKRSEIIDFSDLRRVLYMLGIIAALFKQLENQIDCEKAYAKYCTFIEKLFGIQSIEASNCYYYIGIYYYEEQQYEKASICMRKALYNRVKCLSDRHLSCGDCHYNIGLIYKKLHQPSKAKAELENCLSIRREGIGRSSLPCAAVLEALGKLCVEISDYKNAFNYLQECYEIRKKLIKNPKHDDITRVSLLIIYLNRRIEKDLQRSTEKERQQYEKNIKLNTALKTLYPKMAQSIQPNYTYATQYPRPYIPPPEASAENRDLLQQAFGNGITPIGMRPGLIQGTPMESAISPLSADMREPGPNYKNPIVSETASQRSIQMNDFLPPGGLPDLFKLHKPEQNNENLMDIVIFLLSLDGRQLAILNKTQIVWEENSPLFLTPEFKKELSEYQMSILGKTDLLRTPRKYFLKRPEDNVELTNIMLHSDIDQRLLAVDEKSTISEKNIYKLLQSNSDFYQVLNDWQVSILQKVTSLSFPLGLFIRCIKQNQIAMFENWVEQEWRQLQDTEYNKEALAQLPLFYKTEQKNYAENMFAIHPSMDLQDTIVKFVETEFTNKMVQKLTVVFNDEFYHTLEHEQVIAIAKINNIRRAFVENYDTMSESNKEKELSQLKEKIIAFVKTLDQKQVYQFAILNKFLIWREEESKKSAEEKKDDALSGESPLDNPISQPAASAGKSKKNLQIMVSDEIPSSKSGSGDKSKKFTPSPIEPAVQQVSMMPPKKEQGVISTEKMSSGGFSDENPDEEESETDKKKSLEKGMEMVQKEQEHNKGLRQCFHSKSECKKCV